MFDITKLALKIPNFLTHEECDRLIDDFEQRKNKALKEGSTNINTGERETSSFNVVHLNPYTNNFNFIKEKTKLAIDIWINYLSQPQYFFTQGLRSNLNYSHLYRIMKYNIGAKIHPHTDYFPGTFGSISFNLNEEYEGGEFKFFNGNYTVPLRKGDALIFPADFFWIHEVTPITKGERYSLNSFIINNPKNVLEENISNLYTSSNNYLQNTPPEELLGPYNI